MSRSISIWRIIPAVQGLSIIGGNINPQEVTVACFLPAEVFFLICNNLLSLKHNTVNYSYQKNIFLCIMVYVLHFACFFFYIKEYICVHTLHYSNSIERKSFRLLKI